MLFRVFRLFVIIFVMIVCADMLFKCFKIREELNVADKVFIRNTSNTFCIIRNINSKKIKFRFSPRTYFFIYEDMERKCRIGYYWQHLPLLEKKLNIAFVGSNFDQINPELTIDDMKSIQGVLKKLNSLPEFPLSIHDKIKLILRVLYTDYTS